MSNTPPELPSKFPCWCRAVYSWGGETDKDLGFIEGDLIECLNAGDGSWWMGRLRRDRRMMGLFPSNFVIVLDDGFAPVSRSVSPIPNLTQPRKQEEERQKEKAKAKSRRPFQGYKTAVTPGSKTPVSTPPQNSPVKEPAYDPANPPSTVLWQQGASKSRGPSRSPSPMPHHAIGSSPPPPPPPHRVALGGSSIHRPPSPQLPNDHYELIARTPSPGMTSLNGHTPPMLRDAMEGVMSSLEDMSMSRDDNHATESLFNPWSPEAFDDLVRPPQRPNIRPLSSLGLGAGGSNYSETRQNYSSRHNTPDNYRDGPPQLETYVQRMESRLRRMQEAKQGRGEGFDSDPPEPPPKNSPWNNRGEPPIPRRGASIRNRKSAYELGRHCEALDRTYTTKTSSTNSSTAVSSATNLSNQTSMTGQSVMSGQSAGAFSATSAGSLARRAKFGDGQSWEAVRPVTSAGTREDKFNVQQRPCSPATGVSYHSSHDSRSRVGAQSAIGWNEDSRPTSSAGLGGFTTPKPRKQGFFKKLIDSAKTGAASSRSTISVGQSVPPSGSPKRSVFNNGVTSIAGGLALSPTKQSRSQTSNASYGKDAAREMGLAPPGDWVSMRRDVNRSNTPGPSERQERANRCQILDSPVICPVDELFESAEGDEGADGNPVFEPFQLSNPSFSQVDKAARFITSLPGTITAAALANGYVCRPHRSDVQRLRALFTWCAERVVWDEDYDGEIDVRRVIQSRRGCSREVAVLVMEMCAAIGVPCEVVRGHLKTPGEDMDLDVLARGGNHHWNAVLVDGQWRMMDASLASPTNPKRALYSSVSTSIAEAWYFLARPTEFCYTHVPLDERQQKIVPPVSPDVLLALPAALPPCFRMGISLHNYDTSLIRLDRLEVSTISINAPPDVEIVSEVEVKSYLKDQDGDLYENVDTVTKKRALSQARWYAPANNPNVLQKRYVVKALLPGDEGMGVLKIYAGKRGLMHTSKDIVYPLAMAVPLYHQGENPPYEFLIRHPTPHAMRQDLYVIQPQCRRLCAGETYVFAVRQHAASVVSTPATEQNGFDFRPVSPNPMVRPASAMSMTSSAAGSNTSDPNGATAMSVKAKDKPAKLAIQSPGGKIIRLHRKGEHGMMLVGAGNKEVDGEVQGSVWETVVKCQERGVWRGLVLADRSARWCVWGEWECS